MPIARGLIATFDRETDRKEGEREIDRETDKDRLLGVYTIK